MAPPSKIAQLPQDLRDELNRRIIASAFSNYDGQETWLAEQLHQRGLEVSISRAAIHRQGQKQKTIQERVSEMHAFQAEFGADPMAFVENGNAVIQMLAYQRSRAAMNGDVTVDEEFLKDMSLAFGRMARTASINEDRGRKIRDEERARAREDAAKVIDDNAQAQGMDEEQARFWREKILGIK